jgi:exonuclease SbcC
MMKPVRLKISGLNSFIEEQVIEFDRLTERGLFGIFGPTGSGKSTILDAMTLAMYGKIARESKEFINTQSNAASITYEFEIGQGSQRKRYIVERNVKKDNKGSYKTSIARLREIDEDGEKVLCEGPREVQEQIVKILGLTLEDFTRSVVLPQGKFSEFLKLTGLERRNMLERIFGLEKYGMKLIKKIRAVRNGKQSEKERLEGELSRFEGVSEEAFKALKNELEMLIEEEKALKLEKDKFEKKYEIAKAVWDKQQELKEYIERKAELDKRISDIENKREKLKKAQSALVVKPYIDNVKETRTKIEECDREILRLTEILKTLEEKLILTEKEYSFALERKEREIPQLIDKEAKLNQAIQLKNEIEELSKEIEALRKEYRENRNKIEGLTKQKEGIIEERDRAEKRIKEIEDTINKLKTEPEYREKVQEGYSIEKEHIKLEKDKKEKENRLEKLSNEIEAKKEEFNKIILLRDELASKVERLLKKQRELEESFPGDSSILIQKKEEINILTNKLKEAFENNEKRVELEKALKVLTKDREEAEAIFKSLSDAIEEKKKHLENIKYEIEKIKIMNMANFLVEEIKEGEPCPVCGSIHHPKLAEKVENLELEEKQKIEEEIKNEIEKLQYNGDKVKKEILRLEAEEDLKKKELEKINKSLGGVDLNNIRVELEKCENEFNNLNQKIQDWNNEKREIDALLSAAKDEKANLDSKASAMGEGLKKDEETLASLKTELQEFVRKAEEVKVLYDTYKKELRIENFEARLNEINKNEREISKIRDEEKELKVKKDKLDKEKEIIEEQINGLKVTNAEIEKSGSEKRNFLEKQENSVKKLSDERNPIEYLKEVKNLMDNIKKQEESLKSKLEKERLEKQNIENQKLASEKNRITLKAVLEEHINKLNNALEENSFENSEVAMNCLIPRDEMKSIEAEIKGFEDDVKYVEKNISNIKEELKGASIDEETWKSIQGRLNEIRESLNQKAMDIGAKQQSLKDMEKSLEKVKELIKQKKELDRVLDLLDDLDKLVQGNKFVEFVATSQLKYIAIEASKRLKEITRGRYALELDSSGNFVMRDDFNGGTRRATDTLSGGETFLTSLSLALALSSQIQLKGSAPLELFFLDEGFGTLDSELLEIVISSLEKLHSDRLCVGLISHVEELKSRMPVKLIVTPANQGTSGSKVHIEYS